MIGVMPGPEIYRIHFGLVSCAALAYIHSIIIDESNEDRDVQVRRVWVDV
jgi:hypothetical protein